MAKLTVKYDSKTERDTIILTNQGKGLTMVHDDFDPDSKSSGTLTFSDDTVPRAVKETFTGTDREAINLLLSLSGYERSGS